MDLGVTGKVAIITGGTEGIGRAAAEWLSAEGAKVAIVARTESDLKRVAGEISTETGHEVIGVAVDMRNEQAVRDMVETVVAKLGGVDILVNNARSTAIAEKFENMTNELLDEDFTLKVKGAGLMRRGMPTRI